MHNALVPTNVGAQGDNAMKEAWLTAVEAEHVAYQAKLEERCELHMQSSEQLYSAVIGQKSSATVPTQ